MSDYIERLLGRASDGLHDTRRPARAAGNKERHSVRRDMFDKSAWDQITDQVPALGEQVAAAAEEHPTAPVMYEDLFNLLNQGDPRFHELAAMDSAFIPQHAMMSGMFAAPDFQWVRNETKYDEYNTALAMLSMKRQMEDAADQVQDAVDAIEQAKQDLREAMEIAKCFLNMPPVEVDGESGEDDEGGCYGPAIGPVTGTPVDGEGQGEGEPTEQDIIDRLEQALNGLADAEKDGDAAGEEAGAKLRQGANEAKQAIEDEQEQASAFGHTPGTLRRMSYEERRRLSERLNKTRLAKFAKMLGGFRMSFDAERRRKVNHAPAEIYDIELGNNLSRVVASELNNLVMPELEDLFWLRHAKHELQQWVTKGPERAGKGPIIVVCDESYSMAAALDGEGNTREAWSKAVALGLVDQAKRDNRDFVYIGFASRNELWVTRFENGVYNQEQIIDFAEHFFGGGTSYEGPLTRAMEIIGEYEKARKAKPDVVFITDAECQVGENFIEAWREVKDRADVRCYGIQIGGSGRYTDMDQLVDRLIQINQLNASPEAVTELFRTI